LAGSCYDDGSTSTEESDPVPRHDYIETVAEVLDDEMTFKAETLSAMRAFKRSKPWSGSLKERMERFRRLNQGLAAAYGIPEPDLVFGQLDGSSGRMLSHAEWNREQNPLDRPVLKVLAAVDELCCFITAVAYVRPERLAGMTPKSVRKKMKQSSFAAAVNRDDITKGAELLEIDLNEHITNVITAMQNVERELDLA